MSEAKPSPEITQRAVLETKTVAAGDPYVEHHKKDRVDKVAEKLKEDNTKGALEVMVKQEDDVTYSANAERVIHISRDKDGKEVPETAQAKRLKDAKAAITLANSVVKEGWPATGPEQAALIKAMRPALMRMNPEAKAWFSAANPVGETRMKAFIQEQLNNPKMRETIQQMLEQRAGAKLPDDLEVPHELEFKKIDAERKVDGNVAEQKRIDKELKDTQAALLREFGNPKGKSPAEVDGAHGKELRDLAPKKGSLQAEKNNLQNEISSKEARLNVLISARAQVGTSTTKTPDGHGGFITTTDTKGGSAADLTTEIQHLRDQIGDASKGLRNQLITKEAELAKLADLESKQSALVSQKQELNDQLKDLKSEGIDLDAEKGKVTAEFNDAIKARVAWEKQYVADLQKVLTSSMDTQYQEQVQKAGEIQQKMLEEEIAKAKDPAEKQILEQLGRWDKRKRSGFIRTKVVTVPDKEKIDRDYALLMTRPPAGGPEAIMRGMLRGTLIEDHTTGITRPMTPAEIDAKLADKDFVDKMQGQVVNKLLTRRMKTARIAGGDLDYIAESSWGQGAFDSAMANKELVNTWKQKALDAGVAEGKVHEFFSTKGKKKGALLGVLLALGSGFIIPGIMLKEIIKGEGT